MSKYMDDFLKSHKGKKLCDLKETTKQFKVNQDISRMLKNQREAEKRVKVNKDIQKMLADRF